MEGVGLMGRGEKGGFMKSVVDGGLMGDVLLFVRVYPIMRLLGCSCKSLGDLTRRIGTNQGKLPYQEASLIQLLVLS